MNWPGCHETIEDRPRVTRLWHSPPVRSTRSTLLVALLAFAVARPACADGVRILESDREAVESRVELVLEAKRELLASAFIFGDDPLTLTSLALLRDAARRGVEVRLIVDAMWNRIPKPVLAHLEAEGIAVREFHPLRIDRPRWIFRRLHDKLVIADGAFLIAGGRNVQSTYFGFGHQIAARNYIDTDLLVRGDAAAEARLYFLALWDSADVRPPRGRATAGEIEAAARELDRHKDWIDARVALARSDPMRRAQALTEVGEVRFLHDPVAGIPSKRKVSDELRTLIEGARQSAVIESPYLVPTRALRRELRQALGRGVRIRILTNSLGATDNIWPQAGYAGEKPGLVRLGVELWEYQGPECLHSKAAVLDDEVVIVGSYNLDPRSQNLNREIALVARDRNVAAELRARMDAHMANARRIDARGYPEGSDEPYPGVPRSKVWKLRLLRIIAPLVRGQL